jgi:hypothetical protein
MNSHPESKLTHPVRVLSAEISMAEVLHLKSLWMGDQSRLSPTKDKKVGEEMKSVLEVSLYTQT